MSLKDTIAKQKVSEEAIKEVFGDKETAKKEDTPSAKRVIIASEPERIEKMCRPTFEIPEIYHRKLVLVCAVQGTTIGKLVSEIVTEWLDEVDVQI